MTWLQLDPASVVARVRSAPAPQAVPSLPVSLRRGIIGFTVTSVAGFAPWALAGGWFHRTVGELGMYIACALAFIVVSGPLLHRLIIGPGSLMRFYVLFAVAFTAYSCAWIADKTRLPTFFLPNPSSESIGCLSTLLLYFSQI